MKLIILTAALTFPTLVLYSQTTTQKKDLKLTSTIITKKTEVIDLETFKIKSAETTEVKVETDKKVFVAPRKKKVKAVNKNTSL